MASNFTNKKIIFEWIWIFKYENQDLFIPSNYSWIKHFLNLRSGTILFKFTHISHTKMPVLKSLYKEKCFMNFNVDLSTVLDVRCVQRCGRIFIRTGMRKIYFPDFLLNNYLRCHNNKDCSPLLSPPPPPKV